MKYRETYAYIAYNPNNYFPVENMEEELSKKVLSPEEILLKKEKFSIISEEAKFVMKIIMNTPSELTSILKTSTGKITERTIKNTLRRLKWHRAKIEKTIKELKNLR